MQDESPPEHNDPKTAPEPVSRLGLLLIDLQDTFLRTIPGHEDLINRVSFAVSVASRLGCPVAATEQSPDKLGPINETLHSLLRDPERIFPKTGFSALSADGISEWIENHPIDHLLIAGIESPVCVYQTAVDAVSAGVGATVLSDCIGERRHCDRQPVLNQLLAMDVHILPAETIFYSLLGSSDHEAFRDYTRLVKRYSDS
ncbi:MAG: isochorismatase family protein [Opitutales bacterium]